MIHTVLKVDMINDTAVIGNDIDETMEEYPLRDFNYTPNIGDAVKVYKNGDETMVVLDHSVQEEAPAVNYEHRGQRGYTVNKVAYVLFAVFLGYLGVHHFYAGDSARGVKYLLCSILLCWTVIFPIYIWIKCIIQAVKVGSMQADENGNVVLYHNI